MLKQYQVRRYYRNGMKNLVYDGFSAFFKTEEAAREATKADIEKEKARMPVIIGGIGIENEHHRDLDIVRYEIRKRTVTPWKEVDILEIDPK